MELDLMQFAPVGVIGAAVMATSLFKKFAGATLAKKIIWLPALVVGALGAILIGWGKEWNVIAWDAVTYAAASSYAVLIAKRVIR